MRNLVVVILTAFILISCQKQQNSSQAPGAALTARPYGTQSALTALGSGATYYIAANGSDNNDGLTKSTPWAHLPGMPNCTGNCASLTPQAGQNFILRGGDTWGAADLGINFYWNGTSTNRIYIGVDQTWYSGTSWVRPIFNCQNTTCSQVTGGSVIWIYGNSVSFDNIELTGYQQSSGATLITTAGNDDEIENCYLHGWSRSATIANSFAISNNFSSGQGVGTRVHDNVIDGSDDPNKDFMGGILHGDMVYDNVIRYVYNGMNGVFNDIHGNLVEYNYVSVTGDHCNMVFPQDIFTGNTIWIYNNVIRHAGCAGGTSLFTLANSSNTSSVAYQYNNVLYDMGVNSSDGIGSGGHYPTGVYYVYNNTVQTSSSYCFGNGEAPSTKSITHYGNNHCISSITPMCIGTGTNCIDDGGNLQQTVVQANAAGYSASQVYAYSPTSAGDPTVGQGINHSSMCSGNLAALCNDTTYPEYDSVNHKVVMRSALGRPTSGAWDIGAYQYNGVPASPTPVPSSTPMPSPTPQPSATPVPSPTQASGGGTLVQNTAGNSNSNAVTVSFASPNQTGDLILVQAIWVGSSAVVSLGDSLGNSYQTALGQALTPGGNSQAIYFANNIKGGSNSITFSTVSSSQVMIYIEEFSGLSQTSPIDVTASASGTGTAVSSGSVMTHYAGEIIFGGILSDGSIQSAGSGFTSLSTLNGNLAEYELSGSAGSYAATATNDGSGWVAQLVALKPANATSPPATPVPTATPVGSPTVKPTPSPSPVDTTPPSTTITYPVNGAVVSVRSTLRIQAVASDNVGVTKVEFYVNGNLKCTDGTSSTGSYGCSVWINKTPRAYKLQSKAYDAAGNIGLSPIVTVSSK